MAMKRNKIIPNAHFHKYWQRHVRNWFNQASKKRSRRVARKEKAAKVAPRPVSVGLRPIVRCPTQRFNIKTRLGRGFTLNELKKAGISKRYAPTIGIRVDHRRKNHSVKMETVNVNRLNTYKDKVVVIPNKVKQMRRKAKARLTAAANIPQRTERDLMPKKRVIHHSKPWKTITKAQKNCSVSKAQRHARKDKKQWGQIEKERREAAEAIA